MDLDQPHSSNYLNKKEIQIHNYFEMPLLEVPGSDRKPAVTGKFLFVTVSGIVHFLLGEVNKFQYHAMLLEKFCGEMSIESRTNHDSSFLEILSAGPQTLGGGWMKLYPTWKAVEFYGSSQAYGVFDKEWFTPLLGPDSLLTGLQVTFLSADRKKKQV